MVNDNFFRQERFACFLAVVNKKSLPFFSHETQNSMMLSINLESNMCSNFLNNSVYTGVLVESVL